MVNEIDFLLGQLDLLKRRVTENWQQITNLEITTDRSPILTDMPAILDPSRTTYTISVTFGQLLPTPEARVKLETLLEVKEKWNATR